jgi:Resolvase, N terminal domain
MHSYSRFFRDAFGEEFYLRKLVKQGVKLVSITQPLGGDDDPAQAMMRKVLALCDEYQSKENAKHVLRNMKLNAQQGFWNGSPVPLGYVLVEVEKCGTKIKKTWPSIPSMPKPSSLSSSCLWRRHVGRTRRQRGRQMAQQPWLPYSQGQNLWRRHDLQDTHQHDLQGRVEIQPDVVPHR